MEEFLCILMRMLLIMTWLEINPLIMLLVSLTFIDFFCLTLTFIDFFAPNYIHIEKNFSV